MNRVQNLEAQLGGAGPSIVVLGSCFLDYVAYVPRAPQLGETMHSESFQKGFGGKGANQAVAAGRLGAKVAMVGVLGADGDGDDYMRNFKANGVDVSCMFQQPGGSSGLAMIFVDTQTSNNEIVICPNATKAFTPELARERTDNYNKVFTKSVKYLVCQNEIPLATTLDALKEAHSRGIYTVFNSAPAPTAAEVEKIRPYLPYVSLFCPNEIEAAMITGEKITDPAAALRAVTALQALGVRDVVITLGAAGYAVGERGSKPVHHAGKRVRAVDTTGAGDCFVGSMVFFMNRGHSLAEACARANECAAISVTRKGTQSSYPTAAELPAGLL